MSLRLRLTLLSSAILVLLLLLGGGALYLSFSRITYMMIEEALVSDTRSLVSAGWFRPESFNRHSYGKPGATATLFQTRNIDGIVLDRSPALGEFELPLSSAGLAIVRDGKPWTETVELGGSRLLVHTRALSSRGEIVGLIQAARSLDEHDRSLATLAIALLAGSLLGAMIAFGASWVLVGAALRPIDRIIQTADEIGSERDFNRRVSYSGPPDEVGRLASTFNTMLTELHDSYHQLSQALQAQRRFVADASHELRTPLTTVRGNLELLRREPPITVDDQRAVLIDTIDEAERMMRLVSDLLALARSDAGWQPILSQVSLIPLIDEVRRQAATLDPARPIDAVVDGAPAVLANRDLLKQVLLILLDNALKHTSPGSPVTLETAEIDEEVVVSVRDQGPGIDPELLPHIFERFFRGDSARTMGGAGLGLPIARALVEAQGGSIDIESQVGRGSVFIVKLRLFTEAALHSSVNT